MLRKANCYSQGRSVLYTAIIFYSYSQLVANIHNLGNEAVSFVYI